MAGIDILNQFPNSKMAAAAKVGQSRFNSSESLAVSTPVLKSGSATMAAVNGTTSTATLLALAGVTSFSEVMFTIVSSVAGVTISQTGTGFPTTTYQQGRSVTFQNVSAGANQVTVLTATADVVKIDYVGA